MSNYQNRPGPRTRFHPEHVEFDLYAAAAALEAEPDTLGKGHRQTTLYKRPGSTVALFVLKEGAGLPGHKAEGTVTVQTIEGELELIVAGQTHRLTTGKLLVMAPGVPHDVRALTRAVFLLHVALTPPPDDR